MKILLIADVHNRPNTPEKSRQKTMDGLASAIKQSSADLIVFLGDVVHGPDFNECDASYEEYLRMILDLTGNCPFAYVFGNHDDECQTTKDEILRIISTYPNSLTNGRNYVIDIMGEKLLFIDSGTYYDGEGSLYDTVKEDTINYALENIKGSRAILFQHIIVPEIFETINQYNHFVPFLAHGDGKWVKFKKGTQYSGKMRERPCPPDICTNELKTLAPYLKGACFGHDHVNDFELQLYGTKIIQCRGAGYNCYDKNLKSAVKLLDTKTMNTEMIFY